MNDRVAFQIKGILLLISLCALVGIQHFFTFSFLFDTNNVDHLLLGDATFDGIDIKSRKQFFYGGFLIVGIVLVLGQFLSRLSSVNEFCIKHLDFLKEVAFFCFLILFLNVFSIWGIPMRFTISFLYTLLGLRSFQYLIKVDFDNSIQCLFVGFAIGLIGLFYFPNLDFFFLFPIVAILLSLLVNRFKEECKTYFSKFYVVPIIMTLPLFLGYILKLESINFALISCMLLSIFSLFVLKEKRFSYTILTVLFLWIAAAYWGTDEHYFKDLFEVANPANSIQRFFNGELPFLDYLSSHLLSEQVVPLIHEGLVQNSEFLDWASWLFLIKVMNFAICFLLFRKWLKSDVTAFFLVLFFPFTQWLIPKEYAVGLLPLVLILYTHKGARNDNWFWIITIAFLGLFWKIDSGASAFFATTSIAAVLVFKKKINISNILRPLIIVLTALALIFVAFQFITGDLWVNLMNTKEYFSADQAHGRSVLTNNQWDFKFYFHHFVLPIVIISIAVLNYWRLHKSDRSYSISILYLSAFYLFNFQRGLVRHSLTSGTDVYLSSFGYLIITLFLVDWSYWYFATKNRNDYKTLLFFILISSVIVLMFKEGNGIKKASIFEKVLQKNDKKSLHVFIHEDWKSEKNKFIEEESLMFKNYLDKNLSKEQTFFDFSNHPFLYRLTGRKIPSFFNQLLQNTVTPLQQKITIEYIERLDIPIILYSYIPRTWLDRTDDVPNALRYNLIHSYIKDNYQPLGRLENKLLWVKKGLNTEQYKSGLSRYEEECWNVNFKKYPLLLNNEKALGNNGVHNYYKVSGVSKGKTAHIKVFEGGCGHIIKFHTINKNETYYVPISWFNNPIDTIIIDGFKPDGLYYNTINLAK